MKTTVKTAKKGNEKIVIMDDKIFELRKEIWKTLLKNKENYLIAMLQWL